MKVAILCGGLGTRLAEETKIRPKTNGQDWKSSNFNTFD